jgi:hypothetical protein
MISSIDPVDRWHLDRWTRFTSSENYKLLTPAKPNQLWSSGGMTYIEQKAVNSVTRMEERPEMEEVKSLLWGKAHEYAAYEAYIQVTRNYSMQYTGTDNPMFLVYEVMPEESGGTPDAVSINSGNKVEVGCEIKCPKNSIEHFRRLKWTSQWDVKEGYPLVYTQIQHLMMITGAPEWHFTSFDDRQLYRKNKTKIIEIKPDHKFMDNLEVKLRMAVKEKYKILSTHLDAEVKCKSDLDKIMK